MRTEAGVKSVVFGGVPLYGPMQAVSGTRGSNEIALNSIISLIDSVFIARNKSRESLFLGFTVGKCPY
jgi:hypothetical protein